MCCRKGTAGCTQAVLLYRGGAADSMSVPVFEDITRLTRLQKLVVSSYNRKLCSLFSHLVIPNMTLL